MVEFNNLVLFFSLLFVGISTYRYFFLNRMTPQKEKAEISTGQRKQLPWREILLWLSVCVFGGLFSMWVVYHVFCWLLPPLIFLVSWVIILFYCLFIYVLCPILLFQWVWTKRFRIKRVLLLAIERSKNKVKSFLDLFK
jgi:hypothetical protein